ncbi:ABC-2 transporter permease [Virgibacillus sp. NKC19-16]|uniref:ABC-2 transporter permease n=1 Tax=Virgibacillus salidurans TaxID=2831673 RepID=UPI001F2A5571|nr:ABC-2 transporter permease [Virgibacillus sp. NKC19-16]UJL46583.1 ABC-2 transporter permease [Virgibacillus sp. NKC19-16]
MIIQLLRNEVFGQNTYIYLLVFFWFIPMTGFFTSGAPIQHILLLILFAAWIPSSATYYEQPALMNTLPVTRKKIILAKYLTPLIWFIPAAALVSFYVFLFVTFAPFPARLMTGWDLLLALAGLLLLMSVFYPLHLLFGYVPAMALSVIAAVATSISIQMVMNIYHNPRMDSLDNMVETIMANPNVFIMLLAGISLIITLLSYALSVWLYERKDF